MCGMRTIAVGTVIALSAIGMAACGSGNEPASPASTATVPATPEPTPTATEPTGTATPSTEELEAEVTQAYLAYWDAYAEAVLYLDITLVEDFVAGDELESIREEIEELRADGLAARIRVEHDIAVVSITESEAIIVDQYVNNSFLVDAETREPEEAEGPGDVVRDLIQMERVDGRWVVVHGAREAGD